MPGVTCAATYTVTNTNNSGAGSLRQAILDANARNGKDKIVFFSGLSGTITFDDVDNEIRITDDVIIEGPALNQDGNPQITIDADRKSRIFLIDDGIRSVEPYTYYLTDWATKKPDPTNAQLNEVYPGETEIDGWISNVKTNAHDAGDIDVQISRLRFFQGAPDTSSDGGAIANRERLTIDSCVFELNEASRDGGAIVNGRIIVEIKHSSFIQNKSISWGGVILNRGLIGTISHSLFRSNEGLFGAVYTSRSESLTLKIAYSHFNLNQTPNAGGALFVPKSLSSHIGIIKKSVFSENSAGSNGGAIYLKGVNDEFASIWYILDSKFHKNTAAHSGGAINLNGTADIRMIAGSTFNENSTTAGNGGAISNNKRIREITNSTFHGNTAPAGNGGAIWTAATNHAYTLIKFTTITNNRAGNEGGGIYFLETVNRWGQPNRQNSFVAMQNSILANNTAGVSGTDNCKIVNLIRDEPRNLDANNYSDDNSCNFDSSGGQDGATLDLAEELADHGGSTTTLALFGGPAVAGARLRDCVTTPIDQRGKPRPGHLERCDAGAYEKNPTAHDALANQTCEDGKFYVISNPADLHDSVNYPERSLVVVGGLTPREKLKIRTRCALYLYPGITLSGKKVNIEAWSGVHALHGGDVPKSPFVVYDSGSMKFRYAKEEDASEEAANPKVITAGGQHPVADPPKHTDNAGNALNAVTVETNDIVPKRYFAKDVRITSWKGDVRIGQGASLSATNKLYLYAGGYFGCPDPEEDEPPNPSLQIDRDVTMESGGSSVLLASGDVTISRKNTGQTKLGNPNEPRDLTLYSACGDVRIDQDVSVSAVNMTTHAYKGVDIGGGKALIDVTADLSLVSTGKIEVEGRYSGHAESVVIVRTRDYSSGVSGYVKVGGSALLSSENKVVIEANAGIESVSGNFVLEGETCELQDNWNADTLIVDPDYQTYCDSWKVPSP